MHTTLLQLIALLLVIDTVLLILAFWDEITQQIRSWLPKGER